MDRVGIYEAKAKLSELIEQAERGKEVTITRHGKAVAKLVPAGSGARADRSRVFDEIEAFARTVEARPFDLRRAIGRGRR